MQRGQVTGEIFTKTDKYSPELILTAFDRAFTNLSSDFLAQYILKNDETFEKLIKIIFELDSLFHELEDRFIQGLEVEESTVSISEVEHTLKRYFYRRLGRRINVAAFKFTHEVSTDRLFIKKLSNLDYKCELLASIQK